MPKLNSRSKGQRGERAAIDWLQPIANQVTAALGLPPLLLQRNTLQSDQGGSDIAGLPWLAIEIKNCETDAPAALEAWWGQCLGQSKLGQTPVLLYRRNHRAFRARLEGGIGTEEPWLPALVDVDALAFEVWFRAKLRHELTK